MTSDAANAVFGGEGEVGAPLLIVDTQAQIVHATPDALELFGAKDRSDLQARLLAGEGPTARRLRHLTASLPIGEAPRLERMRFFPDRRAASLNLRYARVGAPDGAAYLVLWAPGAGAARDQNRPALGEGADAGSAEAIGADALDPSIKPSTRSRFLWSIDKEGRFGVPDPVLIEALGANAPVPGETLDALRLRTGFAHGDDLLRAFDRQETFADVPVVWPSANENIRLRMRLSAAPVFERGRDFGGFRGFGRLDEATSNSDEPAGVDAEGFVAIANREMNAGGAALDNEAAESRNAQAAEETAEEEAIVPAADAQPESGPADNLADGSELAPALPESSDEPANAPPERTAEIYVLRQTHAATSKIVPIRPGAVEAPAPDPGQGSGGDSVELSKSERDAFREIARALIGRTPHLARDSGAEDETPIGDAPGHQAFALSPSPPAGQRDAAAEAPIQRNAWALLDRLPIGVLVVRDAQALYLNHTLLGLMGYRDFAHFEASNGLADMFQGQGPQAMSMQQSDALRINRADGQPLAVEGRAQGVNWDGAPATLIAFRRLREVDLGDDSHHIEDGTRSRNGAANDLQDMLDRAADGAVTLDSAGRILSLNQPAERLFGYHEKDVAGESVLMLLAPQSHPETTARLESLSRDRDSPAAGGPIQVVGRDRAGAALSLALTLARVGTPEAPHYCALVRDMSREQEAARKLKSAQAASAAKTDFLAQVSHEIRTPLHAILGFTEVMMEERFGPIGNERYKDYLKDIHASGVHVMSLADDLLDLSKIEAGKLELAFAPVDANNLIRDCVSMMQPQAARERIIMRVSLFERLPQVMVDERSLKQIMLNLMSNAVKFNEPGGQVIVSTAVDAAGQAVIRVRDTGVGMSESEVGLALEPFSRIGRAAGKGGAGLGLPLTKALVEANGAEFSIKSRRDQGTLIEIAFPTVRAA
jgi:PAS domain S-box-containing protein